MRNQNAANRAKSWHATKFTCTGGQEREKETQIFTLLPVWESSLLFPEFHTKMPLSTRTWIVSLAESVCLETTGETENSQCPPLAEEARKLSFISNPLRLAQVACPPTHRGLFNVQRPQGLWGQLAGSLSPPTPCPPPAPS